MDISIDELKCYLTMIIRNEINKFALVNLAKKLDVSLNYEDSFFYQKKKVEHEILQHILLGQPPESSRGVGQGCELSRQQTSSSSDAGNC